MPTPRKGESRKDYLKRAIPMIKAEGLNIMAAIGKAEGMFSYYSKKKRGKKSGR